MLSVIITTKDQEKTLQKSFDALYKAVTFFVSSTDIQAQIIIVTPNSYSFLHTYHKTYLIDIVVVTDPGKGKPYALNLAVKQAKGEYLLCSDGDVLLKENAIYELYTYTAQNDLAIAGGHPVPLIDKRTRMGYWAWVLFEANAHRIRRQYEEKRKQGIHAYFPVSGYLFMIKKDLYPKNKTALLAEDAYTSAALYKKGYAIGYDEQAVVYVQFPQTYKDYIQQKIRTLGGQVQEKHIPSNNRSFFTELGGIVPTITYAKTLKELYWTMLLFCGRLHAWGIVYIYKKTKKATQWKVIESSKEI